MILWLSLATGGGNWSTNAETQVIRSFLTCPGWESNLGSVEKLVATPFRSDTAIRAGRNALDHSAIGTSTLSSYQPIYCLLHILPLFYFHSISEIDHHKQCINGDLVLTKDLVSS